MSFLNQIPTMERDSLRDLKKGSTDDLINDNADLIDSYGSIDFMDNVRNQIIRGITK